MNKEEKLAYLDKLVEPQGNESGMSVAPLLREMIEDAGDQVEVDDVIEAAKEAKETAEAAEAAATAAGTAAQEANTAAGNAQTAADNAQKTADEALQAANDAKQAAADSYVTGSNPYNIGEESSSEELDAFLGGFDNIAQAIDDGKTICYVFRNDDAVSYGIIPYLNAIHNKEDSRVSLKFLFEYQFITKTIEKLDDGTLKLHQNAEQDINTFPPISLPQSIVGVNDGTNITDMVVSRFHSVSEFASTFMAGRYLAKVEIDGGDYGSYQTLVEHIRPDDSDEMVFIHYKSDKTSPIFDRIQGLKIDREAGTVTAVDCPQPSNVQLSDTSPSSDASTASAGTSKTAARADHVHPFAAGDIQNPKSMQGVDLDTILEPGYYEGVPAAKEGNPTVSDFASMVVMRGNGADSLCQIIYADGEKALFRVKPNASNSWADWKPLSETDLTGTAVKPNTFASGDLDTLTQTGMYVLTSDILSDYTNFPPVPTGYTPYYPVLYVYNSGGVVSQTISVNHGDNKLYSYSRNNQPGAFGDWTGGTVGGADLEGTGVSPKILTPCDLLAIEEYGFYILSGNERGIEEDWKSYTNKPTIPFNDVAQSAIMLVFGTEYSPLSRLIWINSNGIPYCYLSRGGITWYGGIVGGNFNGGAGENSIVPVKTSLYPDRGLYGEATNLGSIAIGSGVSAHNSYEIALGRHNVTRNSTKVSRFSVGIGEKSYERNAIELMEDGDMFVYGIGEYAGQGEIDKPISECKSLQTVISELQTAVQTLQEQIAALQGTGA